MDRVEPRTVAVLAACDRFNYGDLLFPLLVDQYLSIPAGCRTQAFALTQSNLSADGAMPTGSLQRMMDPSTLTDGDVVVVGGGGVIGTPWASLHHDLLGSLGKLVNRRFLRPLLGARRYENFTRWRYRSRLLQAFAPAPVDYSADVRVVYNAVGASGLRSCDQSTRKRIAGQLNQADFLSVRDSDSREHLLDAGVTQEVIVSPDSAILMAELYPLKALASHPSPNVLQVRDRFANGFMTLQCFEKLAGEEMDTLARQVEEIHGETELPCVLVPLGRAHGDQHALASLCSRIRTPVAMAGRCTIFDIMALIGGSKVFAGTSLHGNLTAVAYGVPQVGLGGRRKVSAFLNTWAIPSGPCVDWSQLAQAVRRVLSLPRGPLLMKSAELSELARENFQRMARAAGLKAQQGLPRQRRRAG